jgi:hypothetical protein
MINLNYMTSILNFIFTILFHAMRWTKQNLTCICFEEFLNQNTFESNFQFLAAQKSFPVFIYFFLFYFGPPIFILLSFSPISYSQPYVFTDPISSSAQPRIRPTNPIYFGHLRPPDASRHLQPPRLLPHHCSLCHLPLASWNHLGSPSSPLNSCTPRLPLTACHPPPYGPLKGAMRAPSLSTTFTPGPISLPRARIHLPIRPPLAASVERRSVAIFAALPPSRAIGENPDDLFSLSLSLWVITMTSWARSRRAAPWSWVHHGPRASHVPVIHRPDPWLFLYKTILRISGKCQNHKKALEFFNKSRNSSYLFKLATKLYHNQFSIFFT